MEFKTMIRSALVAAGLAAAACRLALAQTPVHRGVEVSPEVYNFGNVDGGVEILRGEFVLRNCGPDEFRITDVVPGCHCTRVEWSDAAVTPGDSSVVAFEYHIEEYTKSFRKVINVMTDRSDEPLKLMICGNVVESEASIAKKFPFSHGALGLEREVVSLGKVYKGETGVEIVKIANRSAETVKVGVAECSEGISAEMMATEIYPFGEGYLRVHAEAGEKWGWKEYSVTPTVNGEAVEPIRMRALTVPDFRGADAKTMDEGPYPLPAKSDVRLEAPRVLRVVNTRVALENIGKEPLEILSAEFLNGHLKVHSPGRVAANSVSTLEIVLDAREMEPGTYEEKLYLVTNSPAVPVCEINVTCVVM